METLRWNRPSSIQHCRNSVCGPGVITSEAERQFQTVVNWARYARRFECDSGKERLYRAEEDVSHSSESSE